MDRKYRVGLIGRKTPSTALAALPSVHVCIDGTWIALNSYKHVDAMQSFPPARTAVGSRENETISKTKGNGRARRERGGL